MTNFINPQLHKPQFHAFGGQHGHGVQNHGRAANFTKVISHGNTKQLVNQTLNLTVQISNFVNKQSVQVGFEPVRHACHHCNHVVDQVGQHGGGYGNQGGQINNLLNQVFQLLTQLLGALGGGAAYGGGYAHGGGHAHGGGYAHGGGNAYGGGHNQPVKNITAKWIAQHGGYKKNADGSYTITKGTYAGHTTKYLGGGKFAVYKDNCLIGHWDSSAKKDKIASPIALDMNGDGKISTTGNSTAKERVDNHVGDTIAFDIDGDGTKENIEWITGDDALLVDTTKIGANGEINGEALFGDQGGKYADGYVKLGNRDANADGQLTGGELKNLGVWTDNGNGVVDAGEVKSLADAGINQMSTQKQDVQNERGETLMRSTANNGKVVTEDVWFRKS